MGSDVGFGERLSRLLAERSMTQLDLASRVGVTRAAMSRYVAGEREPRFVTLSRIASELGVAVDALLPGAGSPVDDAIRVVARAKSLTSSQRAALEEVLGQEGRE